MLACQIAFTLFRTPTRIARIRARELTSARRSCSAPTAFPVDVAISPASLVTNYIEQLIRFPGALQVLDFADGSVRLVATRANRERRARRSSAARAVRSTSRTSRAASWRSIRGGRGIIPDGDTVVEEDDEVFFIAARKDIRTVLREMRKLDDPVRKVVIAGGGNIGLDLARALEGTNQVKIIERDFQRARRISDELDAHRRAARRLGRRGAAARGEHRQRRRVRRRHERRGGQHPVGHARETARRAQGHGADQQDRVRGARRVRHDRHRDLAAADHARHAARARAPRRRGEGALAAARRGRGDRGRRARRARASRAWSAGSSRRYGCRAGRRSARSCAATRC